MKRFLPALSIAVFVVFGFAMLASAQNRPGGGGGGGGGQAAPRGGSSSGGGGGGTHATAPAPRGGSSGGQSARPRGESAGDGGGQASSRPRSSGPVYGQAVPRTSVNGGRIYVPYRYYGVSPWYYYSPYAYGAFGLGFWGYDPYWWSYPYGYGYGYGWGYPYGYGYGYDYGYSGGDRGYAHEYGSLKLKVKPRDAEVYVDGYYMGQVDDFDGLFHHLDLESGNHRIEIRANGYQPLVLDMRIEPGRTVTYESQLRPVQEGPVR